MKKFLSIFFRIFFAVVGIGYIAYTLTWHDSVHLDQGVKIPGGFEITEPKGVTVPILDGKAFGKEKTETVTIAPLKERPDVRYTLMVNQIGEDEGSITFRPGIFTTLGQASLFYVALGLLVTAPIYLIQSFRWWLLLKCQGIEASLGKAFRLTMVGCYSNYFIPGTTGGDVVKAYYVAKNSDRRAVSVMTVIFDRVTGLLGLIVVGGLAGLLVLDHPVAHKVTVTIWSGVAVVVVLSAFYFSRRLRGALGIDTLLTNTIYRLPGGGFINKIDTAARAYSDHKLTVFWAVMVSVPCHLLLTGAAVLSAYALSSDQKLTVMFTCMPVVFLAGSVPVTPQGLGTMEATANALMLAKGVMTVNQIVGMLMLVRLYQMFYSLLGFFFLLKGDIHLHPEREEPAPVSDKPNIPDEQARPNQPTA